jgi:hypothetical protein
MITSANNKLVGILAPLETRSLAEYDGAVRRIGLGDGEYRRRSRPLGAGQRPFGH